MSVPPAAPGITASGGCHCGAIRYTMPLSVHHHSLCHCRDCQRHSGAPLVGWAMVDADALDLTGTPNVYASSEHGRRHFCSDCGTGLFYTNEAVFPGMIDVQSATLDDPAALPPQIQIQTAERQPYMADLNALPAFDRYPGELAAPRGISTANSPAASKCWGADTSRAEKVSLPGPLGDLNEEKG